MPFYESFESNSFASNSWTLENPDNRFYSIDLNKIEYEELKFNLVFFYLAIGFAGFILGCFIILLRFGIQNYSGCEKYFNSAISLPIYVNLNDKMLSFVIKKIINYLEKFKKNNVQK